MRSDKKLRISIITVWLFTISGVIGIATGFETQFLSLTALHLLVYLFLILWNATAWSKTAINLLLPFLVGIFVEFLGVNYGLIFGEYAYGANLGYKVLGVPILIGVNWAILVYCSAAIAKRICPGWISCAIIAAIMMVFLDLIIEISAPRFDFWEFKNGVVPIQNYIGWFIVAIGIHLVYQKLQRQFNFALALHIFMAIALFFASFLYL
ncbi:carotenoid biosynthesis protein [Aquimarina brevivitae]|uniref:Putative membrane protein n=1 Tax=Aquimarina brevivitae TaxID=323412 RepID=A0A4Q7PGR2_9FLAO|nr:carotenoid biosynthesis protein [Aquimarina brevivitae]RZS99098.1 putative membrane protein [Aquimarina brevivitae]